jgi:hypothetical protein
MEVIMKVVKMGEKEIGLKATPLALLYYKQEFKTDLIGDLIKLAGNLAKSGGDLIRLAELAEKGSNEINVNDLDLDAIAAELDTVVILKLVWAMNKASEGPGRSFPGFESWLDGLEVFDLTDKAFIGNVLAEAMDGFFRGGIGKPKPTKKAK